MIRKWNAAFYKRPNLLLNQLLTNKPKTDFQASVDTHPP